MANDRELLPRAFRLVRTEDVSGVSGTGIVAWGVVFPDGKCATRWCAGDIRQTCVWDSLSDLMAIHGHEGRTMVEFPGDE